MNRRVTTKGRWVPPGSLDFYKLSNATFVKTDEIEIDFEYFCKGSAPHGPTAYEDGESGTSSCSPSSTASVDEETVSNTTTVEDGELEQNMQGGLVDRSGAPSPDSLIEGRPYEHEDEELTRDEGAEDFDPPWKEVRDNYARSMSQGRAKCDSRGDEDEPTWEEVWERHLREIERKGQGSEGALGG
jgi:hypothetical protein